MASESTETMQTAIEKHVNWQSTKIQFGSKSPIQKDLQIYEQGEEISRLRATVTKIQSLININ